MTTKMLHRTDLNFTNVLKTVVFLVFLALFTQNILHTLNTYIQGISLETTSNKPFPNGLMYFPTLAICSLSAYKNTSKVMLSLEDYESNTFDPNNHIERMEWISMSKEKQDLTVSL